MPLFFTAQLAQPLNYADFDTRELKRGFRSIGKDVRTLARSEVSRKTISQAGGFPGRDTGRLRRGIVYRVSRSGFSVAVREEMRPEMEVYYPAFVYWGHRGPGTDSRAQTGKKRAGQKVAAPRQNWITAAAVRYGREHYMRMMSDILADALKPGLIRGGL